MKFMQGLVLAIALASPAAVLAMQADRWLEAIRLPQGFQITVFADAVPGARSLSRDENGTVYVGSTREGKVYALRDADGDGRAEDVRTVASGLNGPNGVAVLNGDLYVAEISRILRFRAISGHREGASKPDTVYAGYPTETHHGWKYLRAGPDGKLYVPVGAPCNICLEQNEIFATLTRLDPNGGQPEIYARGIRNTVGFDWHPVTGELFFTDNGRDLLGDDLPPEELNRAPSPGLHFGYPYCHAGSIADPIYGARKPCSQFQGPAWTFPAHVAPLGIHFYRGTRFPQRYHQQLFVAQHGSWNRSQPQGYRVVVVTFRDGQPVADEVFAEGWLRPTGEVLGRPVDVLEMPDGSLLVSDDHRGVIYRITYQNP